MNFLESFDWPGMIQKVVVALIILLVTWLIAKVVKWAAGKLVGKLKFLQREGADGKQIGESFGTIAALIVWLFGLVAILQVFALAEVLAPVQDLLGTVMGYLPNIIGAGIVFFIGYVIAKIARQLIEAALNAVDLSAITKRFKSKDSTDDPAERGQANARIASVVGNLVFAIIIIVVGISALQVLGIAAIAQPATHMLNLILNAIPQIIAAIILLAIGYVIAKFIGTLLEGTLRGVGTDQAVGKLGIVPEGQSASSIITTIVKAAIMVFFGIMAARLLQFAEVTQILNEILVLAGNVLFGGVIIAAGFLIARIIFKFMGAGTVSKIVRYSVIALFAAMGLSYMGIADSIINLAFGAIVVGAAIAAALAFGLGGRDAAARQLAKMQAKQQVNPDQNPDRG
ncbi:mechanosensitive ion channel [Arthrobacter castelli]|uniref:mechanosensitive ion channel n=1 Tax=Arthrobacter castelli TaxID=271431 RepID=UPI0003FB7508|nr:mechanosensitive ion channel [Arthrobacter castelli]